MQATVCYDQILRNPKTPKPYKPCAVQVLGSFDARLREYAARTLHKQGIHLVHGMVKEVREGEVELRSGDVMPYGLCVWSTGVGAPPLRTRSLSAQLLLKKITCCAR